MFRSRRRFAFRLQADPPAAVFRQIGRAPRSVAGNDVRVRIRGAMRIPLYIRIAVLIQVAGLVGASGCQAQRDDSAAVISATLASVYEMLGTTRDAVIQGPIAFDPRVLRTGQGRAPRAWPGSVALMWVGDVSDSVFSPERVRTMLDSANLLARSPIHWVPCGLSAGAGQCAQREFSAIVTVGEPWICNDVAQVLASIRYRSTDKLHPSAWQASVVRLRRKNGRWIPGEWHTQATN
jgi:hypothetical protein